jgi:hypothetical protein
MTRHIFMSYANLVVSTVRKLLLNILSDASSSSTYVVGTFDNHKLLRHDIELSLAVLYQLQTSVDHHCFKVYFIACNFHENHASLNANVVCIH